MGFPYSHVHIYFARVLHSSDDDDTELIFQASMHSLLITIALNEIEIHRRPNTKHIMAGHSGDTTKLRTELEVHFILGTKGKQSSCVFLF